MTQLPLARRKLMKISRNLVLAVVLAGTVAAVAGDKKPLSRSESLQLTAQVESIDQATRTLVLKDEYGSRAVVVAGPEVRNLAQVKAGDRISLTYFVGVAVQVKPKGTPASSPVESTTTDRSAPGERPAAAVGRSVATTVKIDSVDTSFNTVTFKRADGITRTVGVDDPDARKFIRTLKPGDSVEIAYNEATAVGVEPVSAH
jgi:hypothetical protein